VGSFLLETRGLSKWFGGLLASNNISLCVRPGETHALIGPNGAGKTTLINLLQGEIRPDAGELMFDGRDITRLPRHARAKIGMARTFQITSVFPEMTALNNVAIATQMQQGHSFRFFRDAAGDVGLTEPSYAALEAVGLSQRANDLVAELSHGERRQLELAMAIAMKPKLLLLDEPMAGMGRQDSARMTELLRQLKQHHTIVLIEHDMDAVFALADRLSVLVSGQIIATGEPDAIRSDKKVQAAYLGHAGSVH